MAKDKDDLIIKLIQENTGFLKGISKNIEAINATLKKHTEMLNYIGKTLGPMSGTINGQMAKDINDIQRCLNLTITDYREVQEDLKKRIKVPVID